MHNQDDKYKIQRDKLKKNNVNKVYKWLGYADDTSEKPLVDIVNKVSAFVGVSSSYLYTIAIGEGLGTTYMSNLSNYDSKGELKTNLTIDGFNSLGVDDFGDDFKRIRKFLPSDFNESDEFKIVKVDRGEWGIKEVNSADFKDFESALEGFAAMLAHRSSVFLKDSKVLGYAKATEDQKAYWTYCYFQGEGRAKKYLKYNGGLNFKKPAPVNMREVKRLSLERVATWRYVEMNNLF